MGRFVNVTPSWPIVSPCNRRMCPHLHTRIRRSLPSHTRPHRAREIAAKTTTDCNAALHFSDILSQRDGDTLGSQRDSLASLGFIDMNA